MSLKVTPTVEAIIVTVSVEVEGREALDREFLITRKKEGENWFIYTVDALDQFSGQRMLGKEDTPSWLQHIAFYALGVEADGNAVWNKLKELLT